MPEAAPPGPRGRGPLGRRARPSSSAQRIARRSADPARPWNTPAPAAHRATSAEFEGWRRASKALFLDGPAPTVPPTYGSFHAALAAALDPRIRYLVLSGGGDLDGNGGSWDSSSKVMCQGGPYQALSLLPDKGAILYALHQRAGETLLLNGADDSLLAGPHHGPGFFADLNRRIRALGGPGIPALDARFYAGVGHRPSWVNRDAAEWLNLRLRLPGWRHRSIDSLGETRAADWVSATGARLNAGFDAEKSEGGVRAVGRNLPLPPEVDLVAVPVGEWAAHPELYTWQEWARHTLAAQGLEAGIPMPVAPHRARLLTPAGR